MIWAFRNLDMHCIFLAQVRTLTDEDTGAVIDYAVDLPAGARMSATGAVSYLGHMKPVVKKVRDRETQRIKKVWSDTMNFGPDPEYSVLKDRSNQLGPILAQPTVPKIIAAHLNQEGTTNA